MKTSLRGCYVMDINKPNDGSHDESCDESHGTILNKKVQLLTID